METAWEAWLVRGALDELPTEERDVIRLTHYGKLTYSEIGIRLGIPVGTVKSRASRAHSRLRAALGARLALAS
jgi:RNA polymerase sigma-70 factor (ECF subfamily)